MRDLEAGGGGDALDVELARDQVGRSFQIVTAAAFEANEVGREDGFPEFGTFLKCRTSNGDDCWVEMPQDLERKIVEHKEADGSALEGLVFRVAGARKAVDGSWVYSLEWFQSFEKASKSL